ncbi:MAG: hypothetical protein HYY49_12990 [Ignavibacteriales bacterium]|nr:hypothetical protein [Ignavibacteriales bacterium]
MTPATLFWIIVFSLAVLLFFGVAVVITVVGIGDLRDLLRKSASPPKT